jgi:hypothetical protein
VTRCTWGGALPYCSLHGQLPGSSPSSVLKGFFVLFCFDIVPLSYLGWLQIFDPPVSASGDYGCAPPGWAFFLEWD